MGRLGESLCDLAVKNRNFSAHETKFYKSQKYDFALILFAADQKTNLLGCTILVDFFEFQKFALVTDYYRLFCF